MNFVRFVHYSNEIMFLDDKGEMLANVTFPSVKENIVNVNHTFVDISQRGRGIAQKLMEELVKDLKSTNRKAILTCSYAKKWFNEHPSCNEFVVGKE